MIDRETLKHWVTEALHDHGGGAKLLDVMKTVWKKHRKEIEVSGDAFFTWQYDIRWAATALRKTKKMKSKEVSPRGIWELA